LRRLSSPQKIQRFLDEIRYNTDDITRSPRQVLRLKKAHCFDGALFAAAALERLGDPPLVLYMESSLEDDDHVLAIFRRRGCWGAVAKSNYATCRWRDPVYRTPRELVMSYFDGYFNLAGTKTLRAFYQPFDLRRIKDLEWRFTDQDLDDLDARLKSGRRYAVISRAQERLLAPADDRLFRAATLGLDPKGAFKIKGSRLNAATRRGAA